MTITGRTRLYAILGDPVAPVRTPERLNALFAERGVDAVLVPVQIPKGGLEAVWPALRLVANLGGVVVTMPHKGEAARLCDALEPAARLVGAANVVRREPDGRLVGTNLDGVGFVAGLRAAGHEPAGRRVLLVGAGGAGSAIALALAGAGIARLTIANRTAAKAERLADIVRSQRPDLATNVGPAVGGDADLVVNATSLGMRPDDPLPLDPATLTPGAVVADVVMTPSALLAAAAARGCVPHAGAPMLDGQVQAMAAFFGV